MGVAQDRNNAEQFDLNSDGDVTDEELAQTKQRMFSDPNGPFYSEARPVGSRLIGWQPGTFTWGSSAVWWPSTRAI